MESQRPKRSLGAQSSSDTFANPPLKRNIEYSCDRCRSKKLKCNRRRPVNPKPGLPVADNELGSRLELPGQLELEGPCKNCATANAECTWGKVCVPRAPPKKWLAQLEDRSDHLIWVLNQILLPSGTAQGVNIANTSAANDIPVAKDGRYTQILIFPPEDLCGKLLEIYFHHIHILWPVLHKQTFLADFSKNRHHYDTDFGCLTLSMFALASRRCDDPRVLAKFKSQDRDKQTSSQMSWADDFENAKYYDHPYAPKISAGWKYYNRIERFLQATTNDITLIEIQTAVLVHQFLIGFPERRYGVLGAAIRRVQAMGPNIHTRRTQAASSLEEQLWKRVFCSLAICGSILTFENNWWTTPVLAAEHSQLDLPLEIDDEHWPVKENLRESFPLGPQPDGKPSIIGAFNAYVKFAITFKAAFKIAVMPADSPNRGIAIDELANTLKITKAQLPPHLDWEKQRSNGIWAQMSNRLHVMYSIVWGGMYLTVCADSAGRSHPIWAEFSEQIASVQKALSVAYALKSQSCRLCQYNHPAAYMGDIPTVLRAVTITMALILSDFRVSWSSISELKSLDLNKLDIIKQICHHLLGDLQEGWPVVGSALEFITSLEDETEGYTTTVQETSSSSQSPGEIGPDQPNQGYSLSSPFSNHGYSGGQLQRPSERYHSDSPGYSSWG